MSKGENPDVPRCYNNLYLTSDFRKPRSLKPAIEISSSIAIDAQDLSQLEIEWKALTEKCTSTTIYQTWEWNDAWWRVYHGRKKLYLLEVRHSGELIGLAPFYVSRHLGTPFRRLAFLGTGAADYLDLTVNDNFLTEVTGAVLDWLHHSREFDLVDMQQLRPNAIVKQAIQNDPLQSQRNPICATHQMEPCPYITLQENFKEFLDSLSKKMRSNINYYERHLMKLHTSAEIQLVDPVDLDKSMDALFDLHQRRWKARMLPGVMGGARTQRFHKLVAQRFQENGWLRLHVIKIESRPVSALYCFKYRARYYYYLGGFDPEHSKLSLGTVLTARAIKDAIAEGCTEFDFLRGAEPYKLKWTSEERWNERVLIPAHDGVRSAMMVKLNRFEAFVEHKAKEFAEKRGRKGEK